MQSFELAREDPINPWSPNCGISRASYTSPKVGPQDILQLGLKGQIIIPYTCARTQRVKLAYNRWVALLTPLTD